MWLSIWDAVKLPGYIWSTWGFSWLSIGPDTTASGFFRSAAESLPRDLPFRLLDRGTWKAKKVSHSAATSRRAAARPSAASKP